MELPPYYKKPYLRQVDLFPVEIENKQHLAIRDPDDDSGEALVLPPHYFHIIRLFDGIHTLEDIQSQIFKQFGSTVTAEHILELVKLFDERYLLHSERYVQFRKEVLRAYRKSPFRPAMYENKSYPGGKQELNDLFASFFVAAKGPGLADPSLQNPSPLGLVSPHIDFNRGGPSFAHSYKTLIEAEPIERFIILGTDHALSQNQFSLSSKSYQTPLGLAKLDEDFISKLTRRAPFDLFEDELNHRREHSIEFQTVFLKWIYGDTTPFTIVPLLCGSFHHFIEAGRHPDKAHDVRSMIEILQELIEESEKKTCIIAGVDLSHVGLNFGAEKGPDDRELKLIADEDQELIQCVCDSRPEDFMEHLFKNKNHHNICGVSPLYMLNKLLPGTTGKKLHYDYWHDAKEGSMVSFASAVFY